jgi:hypothetical protein
MAEKDDNDGRYQLAGYRYKEGDWRDVDNGAPLPKGDNWDRIDLVTVNLNPRPENWDEDEDGEWKDFYRSANVLGGLDFEHGNRNWEPSYDYYDLDDSMYTLDDLAFELALEYGFAVQ